MAQITPLPSLSPKIVLRQDLNSLLGLGNNFISSLFSPATSKNDGNTSVTKSTPIVAQTTAIAPATSTPTVVIQTTSIADPTPSKPTNAGTTISMTTGSTLRGSSTVTPVPSSVTLSLSTSGLDLNPFSLTTSIASSSPSPSIAVSSSSLNHSSRAGPIAAGVTVAITLLLSAALLAFFYIRRYRKMENNSWKRMSRSPSLLSTSSGDMEISPTDEPKESQLPYYLPAIPPIAFTTRPKSSSEDDASYFGSFTTRTSLTFQKPTLIYVGPVVQETDHRRSLSLESGHGDMEVEPKSLKSEAESTPKNELILPPSLVAGRKPNSDSNNFKVINNNSES